jgi:hypothetical protein
MSWIGDAIGSFFENLLKGAILANYGSIFDAMNQNANGIQGKVSQGPQAFSPEVYNVLFGADGTGGVVAAAVLPVAGMILTFVAVYELIHMIIDRNNMHDIETFMFFKWIFKTVVAIFIVTNGVMIINGFFTIASGMISNAGAEVSKNLAVDLTAIEASLEGMSVGMLLVTFLMTLLFRVVTWVLSVCVTLVIYGRMLEIYLTMSVAPIPLATAINGEIGNMAKSYFKTMFALALQGFFMFICVIIYVQLAGSPDMVPGGDAGMNILKFAALTVMLVMTLFKSGGIAKAIIS